MNDMPEVSARRCLFRNECLQAHLLGLDSRCPCLEFCRAESTTLILTFGSAQVFMDDQEEQILTEGLAFPVPANRRLRLVAPSAADVMLLIYSPGVHPSE